MLSSVNKVRQIIFPENKKYQHGEIQQPNHSATPTIHCSADINLMYMISIRVNSHRSDLLQFLKSAVDYSTIHDISQMSSTCCRFSISMFIRLQIFTTDFTPFNVNPQQNMHTGLKLHIESKLVKDFHNLNTFKKNKNKMKTI